MNLQQFKEFVDKQQITNEDKIRIHTFAEDSYSRGNTVHLALTEKGNFSATFLPKYIVDYYPA